MPQIIPIRDLKNTSEISDRCHATTEPIFVTKNGYGDMVLMSMETYEAKMRMLEIHTKLAQAEEQIRAGQVRPAEDALQELAEKSGLSTGCDRCGSRRFRPYLFLSFSQALQPNCSNESAQTGSLLLSTA